MENVHAVLPQKIVHLVALTWHYYRVYIAIWKQFENVRIQKLEHIYRKHIFYKNINIQHE